MKSKLKDTRNKLFIHFNSYWSTLFIGYYTYTYYRISTISNYISLPYDEISFKSLIEYIGYYFSQSVYWILAISFIISLPIYLLIFKKNEKTF